MFELFRKHVTLPDGHTNPEETRFIVSVSAHLQWFPTSKSHPQDNRLLKSLENP
jgi:hypothetical protein